MAYAHLQQYTRPDHFADFSGLSRTDYYVGLSQNRDSDTLARSNFRSMLRELGGESDTVFILRDSHFLVGWTETIYIDPADTAACETADVIMARLEDYPVVSEDDWSELEFEQACAYWEQAGLRERVEWCQRYRVSVFAARRDEIPEDPSGELISALAN